MSTVREQQPDRKISTGTSGDKGSISGDAVLKNKLLEMLKFARYQIGSDMELVNCPHHGFFDRTDRQCLECDQGTECLWMYGNDEFVALGRKPVGEIAAALEFAVTYIDARAYRLEHDARSCPCEACGWLRKAKRLCVDAECV